MTWKKEIAKCIKGRAEELKDKGVYFDEKTMSLFFTLVEDENYVQILFEFDKIYAEIVLKYYEDLEEYETCAKIIKGLEEYNKVQNTNIQLQT